MPRERKAWGKLSLDEQTTFLDAVTALKQSDGTSDLPNYDTIADIHASSRTFAHNVEEFLTWHRWFIWQFETALRNITGNCDLT